MTNISADISRGKGFVSRATKLLESIGLLNKGSSGSPATPSPDTNAGTVGVSTNSLNVTRVGGTASLTIAVGTAALTLFHLNAHTATAARATAYGAVGLVVSSALIATAVILQSDVRARSTIEVAAQARSAEIAQSAAGTRAAWSEIVGDLEQALIVALRGGRDSTFAAARLARQTASGSSQILPRPIYAMKHSELVALQALVIVDMGKMANAWPEGNIPFATTGQVCSAIDSMRDLVKSIK